MGTDYSPGEYLSTMAVGGPFSRVLPRDPAAALRCVLLRAFTRSVVVVYLALELKPSRTTGRFCLWSFCGSNPANRGTVVRGALRACRWILRL